MQIIHRGAIRERKRRNNQYELVTNIKIELFNIRPKI